MFLIQTQPMNLLPQSLEEFEEDYDGDEDVYIAFKRREKDRLSIIISINYYIFFFSLSFLPLKTLVITVIFLIVICLFCLSNW